MCTRPKPFPSNISNQVAFLNSFLSTWHCWFVDAHAVKKTTLFTSSLCTACHQPSLTLPRLFQSPLLSTLSVRPSPLSGVPTVVGSRCPEHFLYLLIRHAAYVLWLHFNQGSHCVPRRLRPILWNLQGFWLEDVKHIFKACKKYADICWSTSALTETQQSL